MDLESKVLNSVVVVCVSMEAEGNKMKLTKKEKRTIRRWTSLSEEEKERRLRLWANKWFGEEEFITHACY